MITTALEDTAYCYNVDEIVYYINFLPTHLNSNTKPHVIYASWWIWWSSKPNQLKRFTQSSCDFVFDLAQARLLWLPFHFFLVRIHFFPSLLLFFILLNYYFLNLLWMCLIFSIIYVIWIWLVWLIMKIRMSRKLNQINDEGKHWIKYIVFALWVIEGQLPWRLKAVTINKCTK